MTVVTDAAGTTAAAAVRRLASEALGRTVALAGPPEPIAGSFGRGAFACRLAAAAPAPWGAPVVVRVTAPEAASREAAWHAFLSGHGYPVPAVLGLVDGADHAVLVLARGPELSLLESLGQNPMAIPQLLRSMAAAQARLHRLPVAEVPPGEDDAPLDVLDALLTEWGLADDWAAERAWLGANAPAPRAAVACHGDLQPAAMRLDGDDTATAVLVNWSAALVADAEYDVALTLLMFWSAPYLAEGMGQRKMLKTVRDMITDGYLAAYEGADGSGPLDARRLAYWGAFHALRWSAALVAAERRGGPSDAWDPVGLVRHMASYRKDLGRRFARLTRS